MIFCKKFLIKIRIVINNKFENMLKNKVCSSIISFLILMTFIDEQTLFFNHYNNRFESFRTYL